MGFEWNRALSFMGWKRILHMWESKPVPSNMRRALDKDMRKRIISCILYTYGHVHAWNISYDNVSTKYMYHDIMLYIIVHLRAT